ncbi:PREDICTED: D-2-hydroxyglutarate dehydrogenase, mitochondrial-like [Nicrophorus vespilloides]|uniref:D-2-hydroxyglutarate dehydrogenase, mitochondrial n=1 Tax=Nicrophorus vespilloides TaxID=110193 RepID=A0ABM1MID4_NICVS|nr:PREDICTED: D-2-hydroxyglutarate dehydrogenase, mitochondrial-like [Nicrophorus vespilloides]
MIRSFAADGLKRFASIRCFSSTPDFTKNNYNVQRGGYQSLEEDHIKYFQTLLGENRLVMDLSDLEQYNVDWFKHYRGNSKLVLKPKTTEEVSKILSYCNKNKLAVCPQGGNTGVVGGQVPVFDEIIISMALMNQIESVDEHLGVLVCQSGCILENLDNELEKKGFMMPLDLGAKGSCHIGGNVSTNAGGLRLLRYGNMHGNVLGLEAVKANGEIIDLMSSLKKDNTGFHLKHLFIGSEGTLGVVTKVAIQCAVRPKSINLAFLGLQSFPKVLKTFMQAKQDLGEILSAMEVMDSATMDFVKDKLKVESPIGEYPFYLVIETSGSNDEHDADKLHKFLETTLIKHFALNGTVATEPSKVKEMWQIRERIPDSFVKDDYVFLYDVTLPIPDYFTLVDDVRDHLGSKGKVFGFGHLGDGNLHIQVAVDKYTHEIKDFIEDYMYSRVVELKGSISAEHGIGFAKIKYLEKIKDKNALIFMRQMKRLMDPNGILNPYKLIFEQH